MRTPRFRPLLVSLALGVVLSVGIALAAGLWSPDGPSVGGTDRLLRERYPGIGADALVASAKSRRSRLGRTVRHAHALVTATPDGARESLSVLRIELGWPVAAFAGEYHFGTFLPTNERRGVVRVPDWAGNPERLLAYRPRVRGLLVDTLVLGCAVWTILFFPALVRGLLRRRRGRCATCGYPLGSAMTCSECGHAVAGRRAGARPAGAATTTRGDGRRTARGLCSRCRYPVPEGTRCPECGHVDATGRAPRACPAEGPAG